MSLNCSTAGSWCTDLERAVAAEQPVLNRVRAVDSYAHAASVPRVHPLQQTGGAVDADADVRIVEDDDVPNNDLRVNTAIGLG